MEPYRPYVDKLVLDIMERFEVGEVLPVTLKRELLIIPTIEVCIAGKRRPLMVAVSQTTASLYKCFSGELRKIVYPEM
jgi:CRISPR-associated protein Cas1